MVSPGFRPAVPRVRVRTTPSLHVGICINHGGRPSAHKTKTPPSYSTPPTNTTMNSANDIKEILECGTSLAEDVWTTAPSSTLSQPRVKSNYCSESFSSKAVSNSNAAPALAVATEEAWSKIHQLRSRLAADVISDLSSSHTAISRSNNFPTFISPFELPKLIIDDGDKTKRSTDRKSAIGSNTPNNNYNNSGSYQGMSVPLIYCDQTASQRPVRSIEDYIRCVSMPCHANTHTVRR